MLSKVPCKGGLGMVFFCNLKRSHAQGIMVHKATFRWRGFAENGRGIFGHLDQFGRDQGVEPDQIAKHLLDLIVLHDRTFSTVRIKWHNLNMAIFIILHPRSLVRMMSYLEKIRDGGRQANPFFCLMGIDVVSVEAGRAVLKMEVRPDMCNGAGWLQGGLFTALADESMALALYPLLSPGEGIATISESTSFIKGTRKGLLVAEGRVIMKGRRVAFAEGDVRADDKEKTLLSRTSAAFAVTSKKTG